MCFGPSTLGAGAKTRLESRIKKFAPHCIYRWPASKPSRISGTQTWVHHPSHLMPGVVRCGEVLQAFVGSHAIGS